MENYIYLSLGLLLLLASGNYLVDGAVSLARHFKVSTLVVGVVVVSFGTSAPELFVSLQAALAGHSDISIGNVIGSNISNITLVLGLTALFFPIVVSQKAIKFDYPALLLASFLLFLFLLDGELLQWEALIFIFSLITYLSFTVYNSRKESKKEEYKDPKLSLMISIILIILSSIGLIVGAKWLVNSASEIALQWGVSERIISLTLVAFGTSVPELSASIMGAIKRESDISLGNIIGSNLFNILAILGISAFISPIHNIDAGLRSFDIYWMLGFTILLLSLVLIPYNSYKLSRIKGGILLLSYFLYFYFLFTQ